MNLESFLTGTIIGSVILSLVTYLLRTYMRYVTKDYFDKNIENHKQELTKELKGIEFNYQRRIEDFILYTQKRHSVYAELYKYLNKSVGQMLIATSPHSKFVMVQSYLEDLESALFKDKFDNVEVDKVRHKWKWQLEKDYNRGTKGFDESALFEANKIRLVAKRFFVDNELYLSNNLSILINELLGFLVGMASDEISMVTFKNTETSKRIDKYKENNTKATNKLSEIKELMRKELSRGDYTE